MLTKCVSMEKLALPLICLVTAWAKERCTPLYSLHPFPPMTSRRPGCGVMTSGELSLPSTYCSSWESESYALFEQHSKASPRCGGCMRAGPAGLSVGLLTLPLVCWVVAMARERCPPLFSAFTTIGRWESWPRWGHKTRTVLASQML